MANLVMDLKTVKELVFTTRHAAMATVNDDGLPHNTPYFLMYDENLKHLYWGSHVDSQHSQNILRTGRSCLLLSTTPSKEKVDYISRQRMDILQKEKN